MEYIRKPKKAEPDALKNFKPKIFDLVPELKNMTEEELTRILEEEEDD